MEGFSYYEKLSAKLTDEVRLRPMGEGGRRPDEGKRLRLSIRLATAYLSRLAIKGSLRRYAPLTAAHLSDMW